MDAMHVQYEREREALRARIAELEHDRNNLLCVLKQAQEAMTAIKFGIDPNDISDDLIAVFDPACKAVNQILIGVKP